MLNHDSDSDKGVSAIPFGEIDRHAEQATVEMRDGVDLATDVYLTDTKTAPVVLVRLPYDKSGAFSFMPQIAEHVTTRGYHFVAQDVRGKVRSEGRTFAFTAEVNDGYDTLGWIESQTWCDGSVVMFGESYYGFTQWAAAASGHPALKAIAPRLTTTEIGTDWMYHQGVFCLETMYGWAAETWIDNPMYELPHDHDWIHRPIDEVIPALHAGKRSASADVWRTMSPDDPFWWQGIFGEVDPRELRIPALHIGGWWDVFRRGQLRDYVSAVRSGAPGQHLRFEAIDHYSDVYLPDGTTVTAEFADSAPQLALLFSRYLDPALEFFDYYVRGLGAVPPNVVWHLANEGAHESEAWPPKGIQTLRWFLGASEVAASGPAGGTLLPDPEPEQSMLTWMHDASDPVPALIDDVWRPLLGLPDEREVESRSDVMTFTSEICSGALDLAGPISVSLFVQAKSPSTHVMAKLVDVAPDGTARRITEGACFVSNALAGEEVTLDLSDMGYRVQVGHRLRLELATSEFPRYLLHPGTAEDPWLAQDGYPVEQQVRIGGDRGASLTIHCLPKSG